MLVPYKKIYFGDDSHSLIKSPYQDGGEMTIFRENNKIVGGAAAALPPGVPPAAAAALPAAAAALPAAAAALPAAAAALPPGVPPAAAAALPPGVPVKPPPNALSAFKSFCNFLKKLVFFIIRFSIKTTYNVVDSPNYIHKNLKKNGALRVLGLDEENITDTDRIRIKCNKEFVNKGSTISTLEEYQERIMETKVDIDTLKKEIKNSDFSTKSAEDLKIQGGGGEMPTDNMINFFIGYDNDDDVLKGGSFMKNATERAKAAAIKAKEGAMAKATQAKEGAKAALANAKEGAKTSVNAAANKMKEGAKASANAAANKMKAGAKTTANKMKGLGNAMGSIITSLGEDDHEEECEEKAKEKEEAEEEEENNEDNKDNNKKKSYASAFYDLVGDAASNFAMSLGIIEVPEGLYGVDQLKLLYMDSTCPEDVKVALEESFTEKNDVLIALDAIDLLKRIVDTDSFKKITQEEIKTFYKMSLEEIEEAKSNIELMKEIDQGSTLMQDDIHSLETTKDIKKIKSLIIKLVDKTIGTGEKLATTVGVLQNQNLNTGFDSLLEYLKDFMLYSEKSLEEAQVEDARKQNLKHPLMNMGQSGGRFDIDADIRELAKSDRDEYRDSLGLKRVLEPNYLRIDNEVFMSPMVKKLLKATYYAIEKYDLENQLITYYLSLRQGELPKIQKKMEEINQEIQEKEKLLDTYGKYQKSRDTDDAIMSTTKQLDKLYLEMKEYYKIEYDERIKVNNSEEIERMKKLTPAPCCDNIKLKDNSKKTMQSPLCYDELPCSENDIESSSKEEEEKILYDENIPCRDKPKSSSNGEDDDDDEDEEVHCPIGGGKKFTQKKAVDLLDFL